MPCHICEQLSKLDEKICKCCENPCHQGAKEVAKEAAECECEQPGHDCVDRFMRARTIQCSLEKCGGCNNSSCVEAAKHYRVLKNAVVNFINMGHEFSLQQEGFFRIGKMEKDSKTFTVKFSDEGVARQTHEELNDKYKCLLSKQIKLQGELEHTQKRCIKLKRSAVDHERRLRDVRELREGVRTAMQASDFFRKENEALRAKVQRQLQCVSALRKEISEFHNGERPAKVMRAIEILKRCPNPEGTIAKLRKQIERKESALRGARQAALRFEKKSANLHSELQVLQRDISRGELERLRKREENAQTALRAKSEEYARLKKKHDSLKKLCRRTGRKNSSASEEPDASEELEEANKKIEALTAQLDALRVKKKSEKKVPTFPYTIKHFKNRASIMGVYKKLGFADASCDGRGYKKFAPPALSEKVKASIKSGAITKSQFDQRYVRGKFFLKASTDVSGHNRDIFVNLKKWWLAQEFGIFA